MKKPKAMKTGLPAQVFRHVCQVFRAVTKAKSLFSNLLKKSKRCASHVLPMPEGPCNHHLHTCNDLHTSELVYYDSTWNSSFLAAGDEEGLPVSGYLNGHDEKIPGDFTANVAVDDEIDRLADVFIASFHEKFRLEKQESYRRYQEMLARSM